MRSRLMMSLAFSAACGSGGDGPGLEGGDEHSLCARDPSDSAETAVLLPDPSEATGFICPLGDDDYYRVRVPEEHVLRVGLLLEAPLSPVQIHYDLYTMDGGTLTAAGRSAAAGIAIDDVSCVAPGDYVLEVQDQSADGEDFRHPYRLTVTTEPDPDTRDVSGDIPLDLPGLTEGFVACRGDTDRHVIQVEADALLAVRLTSNVATYEPAYRVLDADGTVLYQEQNLSGTVLATDLSGLYPLSPAGTYVVEVLDAVVDASDDRTADADTPYVLALDTTREPDPRDRGGRNDTGGNATTLVELRCGDAYEGVTIADGFLATIGDVDWYRIALAGCDARGIVQVTADATGADGIDPQVRLIRAFPDQPCARDEECTGLGRPCDEDGDPSRPERDCTGWGNSCVGRDGEPEDPWYRAGECAGAAACLDGFCGATQVERNALGGTRVSTAQPLLDGDELWVVVQDFRADAADLDTPYQLRIETRSDPDAFERDNVYNPYPLRFVDWADNEPLAQTAGWRTSEPFCVSGTLATEFDEDWFWIENTCPDQGDGVDTCNLQIWSDFEAGDVDFVVTLTRDFEPFFQPAVMAESPGRHDAASSRYGDDECLFAVQGDAGYHLVVTDNRGEARSPATPDWSDEQHYTVCLESYRVGCFDPCVLHVAPDEPGCNVN